MSNVWLARSARYLTLLVFAFALSGLMLNSTGLLEGDHAYRIRYLAASLPTLFYLAAIWTIQRAYAAIARGDAVETALATLLEGLGVCLFLGGIARVFGQLWIPRLILGDRTSYAWFDVAAFTLGSLGLLLFIMARPLREAAQARAELDEIV
jgi:hypothetical protein